jgi:hypothetical protein
MNAAILDLYGLVLECRAESSGLVSELLRPFMHFRTCSGRPGLTIVVEEIDPPYDSFPPLAASFSTPRNTVYTDKDRKIIDYQGRGAVVQDDAGGLYRIYSRDRNLLVEIFYLLVLSVFGGFCDRRGMIRLHAMGLSYRDKAMILLMPQGAGKSTLALAMLREEEEVRYISDDDPVFTREGTILPFPRPLGISHRPTLATFPEEYIYQVNRMEFGVKFFVMNEYWKGRIETKPLDDIVLFVGRKFLNGEACIEPCSKREVLSALIANAVLGIGLYQGLEFMMSRSTGEILFKLPIVLKRLIRAFHLVRRAKTYRFTLSGDIARNVSVFRCFLRNGARTRRAGSN